MKNLILLSWLIWAASCAPKYTASFQDYQPVNNTDQLEIISQPEEVVGSNPSLNPATTVALIGSTAIEPKEFKSKTSIDLPRDTVVIVKQDTILLHNGDKILGQITEVTSSKLVCRVSEWKVPRSSGLKKLKKPDQVISLKDVFLIKYADGTSESVNFSQKASTSPVVKGDSKKNTSATLGLVFGILSLFPVYGLLFAVPAIIFSGIGMKSEKKKLASWGLALGIVGIILSVFWLYYLLTVGIY
jgi:hypothetical protein